MNKPVIHLYSTQRPNGKINTVKAVSLLNAYNKLSKIYPDIRIYEIYQQDDKEPHPSDWKLREESSILRQYAIALSPTRIVVNKTSNKRQAFHRFQEQGYDIKPGDIYQRDSLEAHSDDERFDREYGLLPDKSE